MIDSFAIFTTIDFILEECLTEFLAVHPWKVEYAELLGANLNSTNGHFVEELV